MKTSDASSEEVQMMLVSKRFMFTHLIPIFQSHSSDRRSPQLAAKSVRLSSCLRYQRRSDI